MLSTDVRAMLAVSAAAFVALVGELWFSWSYVGAGLMLTAVALWLVMDPEACFSWDEWFGLVAIGWGVIAAVLASQAWLASKTTLASWIAAWLIWIAVSRATRAGRRVVVAIIVATVAIVALAVVVEFIGLGRPRAGGLVSNPNLTVAVIAPVLPLLGGLFRHRRTAVFAASILATPVLLTGSRAGILAVGAVALVMSPPGRVRRAVLVLCGVGLVTVVLWRSQVNPESLAWHRWYIWRAVVAMVGDHPLVGIGAGDLGEAMGPYRLAHPQELGRWGHVIGAAESTPLGIVARIGLPGGLLALLALGLWTHRCRSLAGVRGGVLTAIVVIGLFHDLLAEPAALWWWAAVLALVTPRPPPRAAERQGVRAWRVAPALAVAGIAAWALMQPAWAMFVWLTHSPSSAAVERAVRIEPWFDDPMKSRVEELLQLPSWTWDEASEARYWSGRLLEVRRGAAWVWALRGGVDSRVIGELGAWQATVAEARRAFGTAESLEPRLPWYPYHRALMERNLGNLDLALRLALHAVESEPDFVRGWLLVARLELDRGEVLAARAARARALEALGAGRSRARTGYQFGLLKHSRAQLDELERELP